MQTQVEYAAYVEHGDFLAIGEENYLRVERAATSDVEGKPEA